MSEIKQIIDTIEDVSDVFNNRLSCTEKKLLDEVLNLVKGLNTTNGRINSSVENLKLLSKIKSKLKQVVLNKDYMHAVKDLIKGMDRILAAQVSYYNKDFKLSKDFKAKSKLVKELAVENTVNMLAGTGLEANVTNKINEILLRSITSGGMYADLVREMSDFLTTTENGEGALQRYARTWTTTSLNQFAGQHNKLMTDDLDIEWYEYTGSNMDTTREFCEVLREKRYIHKSEFPEIIKGNIDGHQCEIYERTGLPKGMIAGTTPENFITNRGGWNCGHQLVPVSEVVVPMEVRERVEAKYIGKWFSKKGKEGSEIKDVSNVEQMAVDSGIVENRDRINLKGVDVDVAKEIVDYFKDSDVKFMAIRVEEIDGLMATVPVKVKGIVVGYKLVINKNSLEYINNFDMWVEDATVIANKKGFRLFTTAKTLKNALDHETFHRKTKNSVGLHNELQLLFNDVREELKSISYTAYSDIDEAYAELKVFQENGGILTRKMTDFINEVEKTIFE